jgi:amino acid adenylation domain-containing protein
MLLDEFDSWVSLQPEVAALHVTGRSVRYGELWAMARRIARTLANHGVQRGDRVVLHMPKNALAIASMLGILYAGAAYVPIDPRAPSLRVAQVLEACEPRAMIGHKPFVEQLEALGSPVFKDLAALFVDQRCLDRAVVLDPESTTTPWLSEPQTQPDDPAYILYTSGSTGTPKGVVVSHVAAQRFVEWARRTFRLTPRDRLTSFAPLSFDLSVFDLFGALSSGASVDLITPELLLRPQELVEKLAEWRTTTIYGVPSTISLLEREGHLADATLPGLRQVLYAGEPFALAPLAAAMQAVPHARFYNLFGPTETNVCTYHPIGKIPNIDETQVPIGTGCDHLTVELLDDAARPVPMGEEGELCVAGSSVMTEYFRDPLASIAAFHPKSLFEDARRRYRTGDRALQDELGRFWFRGRRDRLIKRRGYRIELGDIEAALLRHPKLREVAAVAESDGSETRIRAFVALGAQGSLTPLILRAHCGSLLPPYMVPDTVEIVDELPRTLTGKLDLQLLRHRERSS